MLSLNFRAPGTALELGQLLRRALPGGAAEIAAALRDGRVRVDGRVETEHRAICPPGVHVRADVAVPLSAPQPDPVRVLARGDGFTVVDKPAGWPSHRSREGGPSARDLVARALDLPLEEIKPAHRLDAAVSGVWLIAHTDARAAELGQLFEERAVTKVYRALAPALPWRRGRIEQKIGGKRAHTEMETLAVRDGIAELELRPITGRTHQLRRHLAEAGSPILGDRRYGGFMVAGGLRLRAIRLVIPALDFDVLDVPDVGTRLEAGDATPWPDEPVWPPGDSSTRRATLTVSDATVKAMRRGHPWVLTDTETTDPGRFRPGQLVEVRGASGQPAGFARIEGPGRVAARRWTRARRLDATHAIAARVEVALARRSGLTAEAKAGRTDVYRLIHGEADGLPGLIVDRVADWLRVTQRGRAADPLIEPVVEQLSDWMTGELGQPPQIALVVHLRERPAGQLECVRRWPGSPARDDGRTIGRERGLRFKVDVGMRHPNRARPGIGLFADQRANRERVAALARGGRWLNLFAHTGAFSVALLEAGASEVVSVDLSRPYLRVLEANLELNDLDAAKHQSVKHEARRFVDRLSDSLLEAGELFDGVVLDPPTAAASGRRFWSIKRDGARLIERLLRQLNPGGHMLVCRNDRGARDTLEPLVSHVAKRARVRLASIEPAPPSDDFPRLDGFPEGDPFDAVLVERAR